MQSVEVLQIVFQKADHRDSSSASKKMNFERPKLDKEIDDILESDVTRDSIMDSEGDEDDDEEEVNSILASDEES